MPFTTRRWLSSLKMIAPSFGRSSAPSAVRIPSPKCATRARSPGVPGATTSRAMTSASMMGSPKDARLCETVDLPVAMPPVRPTTVGRCELL